MARKTGEKALHRQILGGLSEVTTNAAILCRREEGCRVVELFVCQLAQEELVAPSIGSRRKLWEYFEVGLGNRHRA